MAQDNPSSNTVDAVKQRDEIAQDIAQDMAQDPAQDPAQSTAQGAEQDARPADAGAASVEEFLSQATVDDTAGSDVSDVSDGTDELGDDLSRLQEELTQARDLALRAQADAQNVKRRAEQDVERARKYALERFCSELLPVVDNLERALEAARGDEAAVKPIADGVELTLKSFLDALSKFHIAAVDPAGEPFDPQMHQAMSLVENGDTEPNTVLAVMQKGYTLNGRLVRPAMVMVSKAPAAG